MTSDPDTSLSPALIDSLAALDAQWQGGDNVDPEEVQQALAIWRATMNRAAAPDEERFDVVAANGTPLGYTAPRWFCHLTGLRHRVIHVFLTTPQDLLALQMRAHDKPEWPMRFDSTVSGHLKAGQGWWEGALAEIAEEIGLEPNLVGRWLVGGVLTVVGEPYERYGVSKALPPMRNRQVNQLYTGQLTAWGLAHLRFADQEVAGVYLCAPEEASRMLTDDFLISPGLRNAFPRWLAWRAGKA